MYLVSPVGLGVLGYLEILAEWVHTSRRFDPQTFDSKSFDTARATQTKMRDSINQHSALFAAPDGEQGRELSQV